MTLSYKAERLSPIIAVADIEKSIRFYADVLGFETALRMDGYAILARETASLHLTLAENQAVLDVTRGHTSIYLEVRNIEALWAHVSRFRDTYKIRELFDRDYGMREFHIGDPDDCLIFVGEEISTQEHRQEV